MEIAGKYSKSLPQVPEQKFVPDSDVAMKYQADAEDYENRERANRRLKEIQKQRTTENNTMQKLDETPVLVEYIGRRNKAVSFALDNGERAIFFNGGRYKPWTAVFPAYMAIPMIERHPQTYRSLGSPPRHEPEPFDTILEYTGDHRHPIRTKMDGKVVVFDGNYGEYGPWRNAVPRSIAQAYQQSNSRQWHVMGAIDEVLPPIDPNAPDEAVEIPQNANLDAINNIVEDAPAPPGSTGTSFVADKEPETPLPEIDQEDEPEDDEPNDEAPAAEADGEIKPSDEDEDTEVVGGDTEKPAPKKSGRGRGGKSNKGSN